MGNDVTYINYSDQSEFDRFFETAFNKYDRNHDGRIDVNEYQPLINDMCYEIEKKYGSGPNLVKIREMWSKLDMDKSGFITRNEFSIKARMEVEKLMAGTYGQPGYGQPGYGPPVHHHHHHHHGPPGGFGPTTVSPMQEGFGSQGPPQGVYPMQEGFGGQPGY